MQRGDPALGLLAAFIPACLLGNHRLAWQVEQMVCLTPKLTQLIHILEWVSIEEYTSLLGSSGSATA